VSDSAVITRESSFPRNEAELDELLSRPAQSTVDALAATPGDILVLGAGGKMGPTLARMVRRAASAADSGKAQRRVVAVSRFAGAGGATTVESLHTSGVETIAGDLTDAAFVSRLPDAPNLIFMAGQKFGTSAAPSSTWAINAAVPSLVASRWKGSRIVAFSTGNVYPLVPASGRGATESTPPAPAGEYAWSCLARERIFSHYARVNVSPLALVRLNYAVEPRYGVLVDIARDLLEGRPIRLEMGYVNVIWQGDANALAIECLAHAASPPFVANVTGTDVLPVQEIAKRLGELLGKTPVFSGTEAPDALLSDSSLMVSRLRAPAASLQWILGCTAAWLQAGAPVLDKPTHFGERDGSY
jgi:nucleoside-diphosphate-sugar epimerase